MEKTIVEVGMLLDNDKDIEYYNKILENAGGQNSYNCETHDLYWSNKPFSELEKMTENQIKMACVRFRMTSGFGGTCFDGDFGMKMGFQNFKAYDETADNAFSCDMDEFKKIQEEMEANGWNLVLDTFKVDYQYKIGDTKSAIQIQDIDNIGLVLYYDNPDYYQMSEENQREMLIKELNSYGFDFKKDELGIDKIRTLMLGSSMFSRNQNG